MEGERGLDLRSTARMRHASYSHNRPMSTGNMTTTYNEQIYQGQAIIVFAIAKSAAERGAS